LQLANQSSTLNPVTRTIPVPELDALGDFAVAAAKNARRLLTDAELLTSRGRWAGAYSDAILAFEEAGKAWLCAIAMIMPDESRDEFPFGDLDWDHTWKLGAAHGMAFMLAFIRGGEDAPESIVQDAGVLQALAREHNEAKQRGIYADLRDGVVWDPASITREEAKTMVAAVRDLLDYSGLLADPEFITWLANMPEDVKPERDAFWDKLRKGWEQDSYAGMARALQGYMEELGAIEGLREMWADDVRRVAMTAVPGPRRSQPRRPPSRASRRRR
jgi:AbiV family abortive infection protein